MKTKDIKVGEEYYVDRREPRIDGDMNFMFRRLVIATDVKLTSRDEYDAATGTWPSRTYVVNGKTYVVPGQVFRSDVGRSWRAANWPIQTPNSVLTFREVEDGRVYFELEPPRRVQMSWKEYGRQMLVRNESVLAYEAAREARQSALLAQIEETFGVTPDANAPLHFDGGPDGMPRALNPRLLARMHPSDEAALRDLLWAVEWGRTHAQR